MSLYFRHDRGLRTYVAADDKRADKDEAYRSEEDDSRHDSYGLEHLDQTIGT